MEDQSKWSMTTSTSQKFHLEEGNSKIDCIPRAGIILDIKVYF